MMTLRTSRMTTWNQERDGAARRFVNMVMAEAYQDLQRKAADNERGPAFEAEQFNNTEFGFTHAREGIELKAVFSIDSAVPMLRMRLERGGSIVWANTFWRDDSDQFAQQICQELDDCFAFLGEA
jgi:hypothetical protein